ncbi:hypothetical protein TNIN_63421 [Trichonephila inaurata madagascariensis]|uniref:Uncharacterized protein n=1 Tax=Trichonephila inaurata madagascariensis TaxID=2747483 RepID=A0A8X6JNI2_9ARAC|nr:hypothetical protein TNIN_63421 [Trichonephila inaurata madagascariensis]
MDVHLMPQSMIGTWLLCKSWIEVCTRNYSEPSGQTQSSRKSSCKLQVNMPHFHSSRGGGGKSTYTSSKISPRSQEE